MGVGTAMAALGYTPKLKGRFVVAPCVRPRVDELVKPAISSSVDLLSVLTVSSVALGKLTVTVMVGLPPDVGDVAVPMIFPLALSMLSPDGKPDAENVAELSLDVNRYSGAPSV